MAAVARLIWLASAPILVAECLPDTFVVDLAVIFAESITQDDVVGKQRRTVGVVDIRIDM